MSTPTSARLPLFNSVVGVVALVTSAWVVPACVIPGKVGDDPEAMENEDTSASGTGSTVSATGSIDLPPTTSSTGGITASSSISGTVTTAVTTGMGSATAGPLDPESALLECNVPVTEPPPEGPVYEEFIECLGGCTIHLELAELINLFDEYGDCLCAAMECGPLVGGGGGGPVPDTDTFGDTTDTGAPDECMLPPGIDDVLCECETCAIELYDVDAGQAAAEGSCACMCANAGCGAPV